MISDRLLLLGLYLAFLLFLTGVVLVGDGDPMARCQLHHSFGTCHDALN